MKQEDLVRIRQTVDDAATALDRLIWQLPEYGAVDGSNAATSTPGAAVTREKLKQLEERIQTYLGLDGAD